MGISSGKPWHQPNRAQSNVGHVWNRITGIFVLTLETNLQELGYLA